MVFVNCERYNAGDGCHLSAVGLAVSFHTELVRAAGRGPGQVKALIPRAAGDTPLFPTDQLLCRRGLTSGPPRPSEQSKVCGSWTAGCKLTLQRASAFVIVV